jgi:membrane protein implicated in regulation of membrane protease activity
MKRIVTVPAAMVAVGAAVGLVCAAGPALAYIGPGAGLSLLGALWAIVAAVLAALLFLLIWPIRRLLRRRHANAQDAERQMPEQAPGAAARAQGPARPQHR